MEAKFCQQQISQQGDGSNSSEKNAKSLIAMAGFKMDSNVAKSY